MFEAVLANIFPAGSNADPDHFVQLLSGGKHDIDVADLRNNTRYTGGYSEGSRTIKLFWEVFNKLDESWIIVFFLHGLLGRKVVKENSKE